MQLIVQTGPEAGLTFNLNYKPKLILGRVAGCDIRLNHEDISDFHLQIEARDSIMLVTDIGSQYGSYLNGLRLYPSIPLPLRGGDYLMVGGTILLAQTSVQAEAHPARNNPAPQPGVKPGSPDSFKQPPLLLPVSGENHPPISAAPPPPVNPKNNVPVVPPLPAGPQSDLAGGPGTPARYPQAAPPRLHPNLPPVAGPGPFQPMPGPDRQNHREAPLPVVPPPQNGLEYPRGQEYPGVKKSPEAMPRPEGPLPPLNYPTHLPSYRPAVPLQPARTVTEVAQAPEKKGFKAQPTVPLPAFPQEMNGRQVYSNWDGVSLLKANKGPLPANQAAFQAGPVIPGNNPIPAGIPGQISAGPVSRASGNSPDVAAAYPGLTLPGGRVVNPWLAMLALMFGFFMALLDSTVVNVALSDIQTKLKTDLSTVSWVLNAYNLVFAVLLVTMGRFADLFGRKRMYMIGMVLFSLGSLLCAVSPSIGLLIGARVLQGVGAAVLNPISLAILTVIFPPKKQVVAISIWGALAGLAAAIGPVLGGILVQNFDWPSIFLVNLPFCVIGLFLVYRYVPENKDQLASRKIDLPGLLTLTAGMFCLMLAIIQGNDWGWTSTPTLALFGGAALSLLVFFLVEAIVPQPILDLSLFKYRGFTVVNIAIFMFGIAMIGAFLMLVLYYINVRGYDVLTAGYALIPLSLASFVISAIAGRFSKKLNPRYQGMAGMALVGLGFFSLATLQIDATYLDTAWRSVIIGTGMGLCFTSFPAMVLTEIPKNKVGVGSGAYNTARQVGFALGVAILVSVFTWQIKDNLVAARTQAVEIVQNDTRLPELVRSTIASGLQNSAKAGSDTGTQAGAQVDLTILADSIPDGQALKPELAALSDQIGREFKKEALNAFIFTWLIAGITGLLGLIPAFFTKAPPRPATNPQAREKPAAIKGE
ncbi:MAG TPA: DHA2 family efflux MFS transporter permease subunit [Chloroflexia bacterium]|nr:DHA2 family efflux MFS transporter permease subunit [Chloroflexia bacterium]